MKVYEDIPPLTARMGFMTAAADWLDAAVLEFGPEGTMHYTSAQLPSWNRNIYTTGMEESHIIFGDTSVLEDCIRYLDERVGPRLLLVTASAVSDIIGADLEGVCRDMQPQVKAQLMAWTNLPLGGDYDLGRERAHRFAAEFIRSGEPGESREKSGALVIGAEYSQWKETCGGKTLRERIEERLKTHCLNGDDGTYSLGDVGSAAVIYSADITSDVLAEAAAQLHGTPWHRGLPVDRENENRGRT